MLKNVNFYFIAIYSTEINTYIPHLFIYLKIKNEVKKCIQCNRFDSWTTIFLNEDHLKRMVGNLKHGMAYHKIEIES
ncbi:Uncharacterised protein [Myroides odoratus]|uniref:Uncharacterized protein n=1 Tax=Myroides odoratus TaxID=256 RepID=A0A378RNL6_MYROD|nr:Uncharacterised protein [Myroides odoratus]